MKTTTNTRSLLILSAAALLLALAARTAHAADDDGPKAIQVDVNGSRYIALGAPISRVSVGAADVADVAAFPPDQLLVTGKRIGQTTAAVWTRGDQVVVLTIDVTYPTAAMTAGLRAALPEGRNLSVSAAGATLVITGEVVDPADVVKAEQIVAGYAAAAGTPIIVNNLKVPGDFQVQLEVSFAEVSRTALKEMGFNFWHKQKAGDYAGGVVSPTTGLDNITPVYRDPVSGKELNLGGGDPSATPPVQGGLPAIATPLSGAFGVVFSSAVGKSFPFAAALSVLSRKGYARTLSEPTLVAMSGETAEFLAGGEFPVPIPQGQFGTAIEYKKFGVQLRFTPTVVGDTIQLTLATTVSDIDFSLGVSLAGATVPGLTERHSSTTVRLRDGQSFAIAGLLSDRVRSSVDKVPVLGDLPILGALFRSTSYRREETELLVVVTARIVRPTDDRPALPGEDMKTDPGDLELFLLGSIESKASPMPVTAAEEGGGEGDEQPKKKKKSKKSGKKPAGKVGFKR